MPVSTKDDIFEKVKEMISNQLEVQKEKIALDSSFKDDLHADSLDLVELVMKIEEEFSCQIPDEAAEKMSSVNDLVEYIHNNS